MGLADRPDGGAGVTGVAVHSLGTVLALAAAVLCPAWAVSGWLRERAAGRRPARLLAAPPTPCGPRPALARLAVVRSWWGPVGALALGWLLIGGATGLLVGGGAAWLVRRRQAAVVARARPDPGETARQLPFAADLLAACLAAGAGPREAAEVVGESLDGPVGEVLARVGAELRLGGDPSTAWARLAGIPGARPLAACLERAARTGAPAAEPVARLAAGLREDRARAAAAQAQRAAVLITAPVGLCFLPAFLAVGVAPVVIGLASGLLTGG